MIRTVTTTSYNRSFSLAYKMKIDHVAIAVNNVDDVVKQYKEAFAVDKVELETVETEGIRVAILHLGDSRIELMEPTRDDSPIKKFLEKKGQGLHHIALQTENIDGEVTRMKECGIQFLGDIKSGSRGTKVTFIHPKSLSGVLTELCSKPE